MLALTVLLALPLLPAELWLVKTLVDRIQQWSAPEPIGPIVAAAAWLALLMGVSNIGLGVPIPMAQTRLNEIGALEGQRLLLHKTARLPLASVEAPHVGDLRERAMQVSIYETFNTGVHMMQTVMRAAVLIGVMLVYGQTLPAVAVCAAALLLAYVSGRSAESLEKLNRMQAPNRRLLAYYASLMTKREAAKEIRLFGLGGLLADRWKYAYERQADETGKAVRASELRKIGPELLSALIGGLIVAMLVLLPGASGLSAGDFSILFMAVTMLVSQLPDLIGGGVILRRQRLRWEDFRAYMELEDDKDRGEEQETDESRVEILAGECSGEHGAAAAVAAAGTASGLLLEVTGLRFRYPGALRDTIHELSLTIPPGCTAALVGENGSGKSTLVKLLAGLYAPSAGEVVWRNAGSDASEAKSSASAAGNFSAVFQDFAKLQVTLRENVALGRLSAIRDDPAIQSALQDAGSRLRELDRQIGAPFGGIEPSGGEWQKIVTARALLRDAGFVFFDEPTAALDPQAEKEAFELFHRVTEGRSSLLVTHRLGAAKLADTIFVLKEGRLEERGTHDELMRLDGEYSRMFRQQARWYE